MKNITLSIPDDLLMKSREYASTHGTSLNNLIRKLLRITVMTERKKGLESLFEHMDKVKVSTSKKWTREELYER